MMGQTSGMEKSVKSTAAIATAYLIAKFGADDDTMSQAAAATDGIVGIFQHITAAAGDEIRVMMEGISRCVLGGTVTRGGAVTSDANGKGVAASLGQNYIGFALASGVNGDIIPVFLSPGIMVPSAGVDGISSMLVARADYDFAVHGGVVGDILLGVTIPNKAVILAGFGDIVTAFTSTAGTGTIALKLQSAGDLLAAVDADTLSGRVILIPDFATVGDSIKLTAARELTITVATNAILSGKAVFFVMYVISD